MNYPTPQHANEKHPMPPPHPAPAQRPPSSGEGDTAAGSPQERRIFRAQRGLSPKTGRALLLVGLCLLFLIGLLLGMRWYEYSVAQREYQQLAQWEGPDVSYVPVITPAPLPEEAAQVARAAVPSGPLPTAPLAQAAGGASTPSPATAPIYAQVADLQRQNKDAVAWLNIPGTQIQYPVVQGEDNQYYETHTFQKKRRASGSIFMDSWNLSDFSDRNTVIYGHNMKDGSMFAQLREYRHPDFLREHKYVEITALSTRRTYKVFAAYSCDMDQDFRGFTYSAGAWKYFLAQLEACNEIKTNTTPTREDPLLTLVTCTSGTRDRYWVVHYMLTGEEPAGEEAQP